MSDGGMHNLSLRRTIYVLDRTDFMVLLRF